MESNGRMKTEQKKDEQSQAARQRAEIIMKVRCGLMTATQAAQVLGVSRKTYYKWEQRGLAALLEGVQDQEGGRPETPPEQTQKAAFDKEFKELQQKNELLEKQLKLKDVIYQLRLKEEQEGAKKK
jgi:DNA-binding XRE family transcriptional regulator